MTLDNPNQSRLSKDICAAFNYSASGLAIIEEDGTVSLANTQFSGDTGYLREDIEGKMNWKAFFLPGELERMEALRSSVVTDPDRGPIQNECRIKRKNGTIVQVLMTIGSIPCTKRIVCGEVDIAGLKCVENALRSSEEAGAILNASRESIFLIDHSGTILTVNNAGAQRLGTEPSAMIGKCLYDFFPDDVVQTRKAHFQEVIRTGKPIRFEDKRIGRFFDIVTYPVPDEAGQITKLVIYATDITERKQIEEELRKSRDELVLRVQERMRELQKAYDTLAENERLYRNLFENALIGMFQSRLDGSGFIRINKAFATMLGYDSPEEVVSTITDTATQIHTNPKSRHDIIAGLEHDPWFYAEQTYFRKDGTTMIAALAARKVLNPDGTPAYLEGIIEDITKRKNLEDQLLQSQKMEAIGTLAGGVAHDFNNILTTIIGFTTLLKMESDKDDPKKVYIDCILSAADKAANLTRGLLTFSRKQPLELKPCNFNQIIKELEKLLKRLLTEDIEFEVDLTAKEMVVMCDAIQVDQVLVNLASNARDAMPQGGKLAVRTEEVFVDSEFTELQHDVVPGPYALLSVTDTGVGMDEKTSRKMFEPFYTTKEVGRGTGLGLSVVYGIIKQHNGFINVQSEPGKGTTFRIYLPAVNTEVNKIGKSRENVQGGTETILIAEDNHEVRRLLKAVLGKKGYTVLEAVDGEDAIRKFKEHRNEIHLLILDVVMPVKNGKEVFDEIRKLDPNAKVLFMSGYTKDVILNKGVEDNMVNFIKKPLSPDDVLMKVRHVIDG